MDPEILKLLAALVVGVVAGFIGSISSGGGLISIPMLIFLGLPVDSAIGTVRVSGFGLFASAIPRYHRAGKVDWGLAKKLIPVAIVAALIGSKLTLEIPTDILAKIVAVILLLLLPIMLSANKSHGIKRRDASDSSRRIGWVAYFLIMIYGGFFGGGAGILFIYTLVHFFGLTYIEGNATGFVAYLFSAIATSAIFISQGLVRFDYAVAIAAGSYVGSHFGVRHALKKGNAWVRSFFAATIILSSIKLLLF